MQILPVATFAAGAALVTTGLLGAIEVASALGAVCITGSFAGLLLRS